MGMVNKNNELKKNIYVFFIYAGILFLSYSQFFHYRITSDNVPGYGQGYRGLQLSLKILFLAGPFQLFACFISLLFNKLGQDHFFNTELWQFAGIIIYAWSATIVHDIIKNISDIKSFFIFLGISLLFVNPFFIEFYVYHNVSFPWSILFTTLSIFFLLKHKYFICVIFSYLAQSIYQINIFLTFILCITIIYFINYDKNMGFLMKEEVKNCLIAVTGNILFFIQNMLYIKFYGAISVSKDPLAHQDIGVRLNRLCYALLKMYKSNGFFFRSYALGLFVIICIVMACVSLLIYYLKKKEIKKCILEISILVLICGVIVLLSVSFFFVVNYSIVARLLLPVAFAISMLALIMIFFVQKSENRLVVAFSSFFLIFFSCYIHYKTQTYITDSYIAQAEDEFIVRMIENKINEYTEETGIQVTEIVTSRDFCRPLYEEQFSKEYSYNHKIYYDEWAMGNYVNLINNENYEYRVMTSEERERYFSNDSLTSFDLSKQLVFDGDTVYWLAY